MQWLFELSAACAVAAIALPPATRLLRPLMRRSPGIKLADRVFGFPPLQPAPVLARIPKDRRDGHS